MRVGGGSNVFLVTTVDFLHNVIPYEGAVIGTGEIKAKVTVHGDLIVIFEIGSRELQIIITRCCIMPTNLRHALGLSPFRRTGCKKSTHDMYNEAQITWESREFTEILIQVPFNYLDFTKTDILSPGGFPSPIESHKIEYMM